MTLKTEPAIKASISGLKCDNKTCDYRDDSIKIEDYERYIDAPCPKCGQSLLTQADYNSVKTMMKVVGFVNSIPAAILKRLPGGRRQEKVVATAQMNGTGEIGFTVTDANGNKVSKNLTPSQTHTAAEKLPAVIDDLMEKTPDEFIKAVTAQGEPK